MNDAPAPERRVYTVKEFANGFARWLASKAFFRNVAISGEVSDIRSFGNGHVGFRLKEEQAVIECLVWADQRRTMPEIENGMAVVAVGSIGIRQERGCYQLVVESLELTGLGALFVQYERLKERFRAEGLFEDSRKRRVPPLPHSVALISARGKAVEDFVGTLERKSPFIRITFLETQVQGVGAEIEIATALDRASLLDVDVVVLTRGGGSYEDLFPFNLEPVVRGIVRSRHPVLTAIGHSGDRHLADFAADMSFGTPSLVAEHIAQGWVLAAASVREAERALMRIARDVVLQASSRAERLGTRLRSAGERIVSSRRLRLVQLGSELDRRSPQQAVARDRERLAGVRSRLQIVAIGSLNDARRTMERFDGRLDACNPTAPLSRGYAIVTHAGKTVRDASALHKGDAIEARFQRGTASAVVEGVRDDE